MKYSLFCWVAAATLLVSCATVGSLGSPTIDYRNYVESHLKTERQFDRGAQTFSIKALVVNETLFRLQESVMNGRGVAPTAGRRTLILAMSNFNLARFARSDLRVTLGGRAPATLREITATLELKQLYAWAYPHYRVFVADFDTLANSASSEILEISRVTPALKLEIEFGDGLNNGAP